MAKHHLAAALAKAAEEREGPLRPQFLAHAGEADHVGEQHRHHPVWGRAEARMGPGGERVGDVGRDVAGEVGPHHLGANLRQHRAPAAPYRDGEQQREQAGDDPLRPERGQADIGRVEEDLEALLAAQAPVADGIGEAHGVLAGVDHQTPSDQIAAIQVPVHNTASGR